MIKSHAKPILARLVIHRVILLMLCEIYQDYLFRIDWSRKELRGLLRHIKKLDCEKRTLEWYLSFY
jgi:hypothetical protein